MAKRSSGTCCTPKPMKERPLLSPIQAGGLAAVFKVLANDTRLRLLHALVRSEELGVNDLAAAVGMRPQASSRIQLPSVSLRTGMTSSRRAETARASSTDWSICASQACSISRSA